MTNKFRIYTSNNATKTIEKNSFYQDISGITLNIKDNFSKFEYESLYKKTFRKEWLQMDVKQFEYDYNQMDKSERGYARLLSIYRRINIDFLDNISDPVTLRFYPMIDEIENFKIFDNLFEKYYPLFEPNATKKIKEYFYKRSKVLVLKLWMSGYGILPNLTDKHVDDTFLDEIYKFTRENDIADLTKFLRFISFVLSKEEKSPVSKQIVLTSEPKDIFDREMVKWDKVQNEKNKDLLNKLKDFSINHYYKRTSGRMLHEYTDNEGNLQRETYEKISMGSFVNYSISLRNVLKELENIEVYTIEDALEYGILDVLSNTKDIYEETKYGNMKVVIKAFVEIYIKDNNLNLNINKIVPPALGRKDSSYGQVLNVSDVVDLIKELSDDDSPFYENITLSDYRCRYMCLIMLSTGQRLSEVICLGYDCITKNKNGDLFIDFHKTKTGSGNLVPAASDVLNYVEKLRAVAPQDELEFSTDKYPKLDNLKIRRLVANKFNDGPIAPKTVTDFLERLQKYLWKEDFEKKDKIFTSHDFRRMKATYMSWSGQSEGSIARQLGQSNVKSQLPYLQTKPVEHQETFANMYQEGMYSELYKIDENGEVLVNKDAVMNKAKQISSASSYDNLIKSLLSSINKADDITIKKVDVTVLEPTGFPVSIYGCSASNMVHCKKSKISCFGCDFYKPDEDSLDNHKAELFRYLILAQYQSKTLKSSKDIVLKSILGEKVNYIQNSIETAFDKLFNKFNLSEKDVSKIKEDLEKKSKSYSRKYGKTKPMPSFKEALKYIKEGKL
ncbi:TPA: site-specific integrase [Clostridioides difficile]|mgnify:CR=1 FL=1|nr:site-specific integrase [Clostridioides difficile]HBF8533234.1 site-specific integrase [Clostridioides difficile]HBH2198374.1 site-specific integrase [Clostridioides difficile]HBH2199833.1 site-specific integrase [Clostridioides difficile]HCQ6344936.1 site-specific integrase [Clostridioides difficile]